jgi:hypothetical protein
VAEQLARALVARVGEHDAQEQHLRLALEPELARAHGHPDLLVELVALQAAEAVEHLAHAILERDERAHAVAVELAQLVALTQEHDALVLPQDAPVHRTSRGEQDLVRRKAARRAEGDQQEGEGGGGHPGSGATPAERPNPRGARS